MKIRNAIGGYKVKTYRAKVVDAWATLFRNPIQPTMTFRFSTSIQNFAERVQGEHEIFEWSFRKSLYDPTAFIGLYHEGDWLRILLHRGPRLAFWCGGDILNLQRKPLWQWLLKRADIDHVCENEVEFKALQKMGIKSRIHPILFFDDWKKYPLSFKPSNKPHVWLTCHPGREREYGVELVEEISQEVPEVTFHIFGIKKPFHEPWFDPISGELMNIRFMFNKNVVYHGHLPSNVMDEMIKNYQCGLRTLEFDGCPHTITKGILLGQHPISRIPYAYAESYKTREELILLLKNLKKIKKANLIGRKHWLEVITKFPWN